MSFNTFHPIFRLSKSSLITQHLDAPIMSSNKSVSTVTTASATTASTTPQNKFPKKIFLYISPVTTEAGLKAFLRERGFRVKYVHILRTQEGHSRGMAFVVFRWYEDAVAAMENINGCVLDSMILHPDWAKTRPSPLGLKPNQQR